MRKKWLFAAPQNCTPLARLGARIKTFLLVAVSIAATRSQVIANPYLAKAGERSTKIRIATCAVSGGFAHLYTALENHLFDKYGFRIEHVFIRGSGPSLAALMADEIQFLYCAADATIPSLAAGVDVKLVAAPLIKLPYVLVTRKEIHRLEDLKGKSLGVARAGDLSDRCYQAMAANIVQGIVITPPLDVRARNDGYNVTYRLIDMDIPFIYSSLHASSQTIRERPEMVQRMVAAFAEAIHFTDNNPAKTKAAIAKAMRVKDEEALQVSYNVYTKDIVDRHMIVPSAAVAESVELQRRLGVPIKRRAEDLYDNSFVNNLEKSGFQRELWSK